MAKVRIADRTMKIKEDVSSRMGVIRNFSDEYKKKVTGSIEITDDTRYSINILYTPIRLSYYLLIIFYKLISWKILKKMKTS